MIAGKAIGFIREIVIAGTYGASQVADVYFAAVTIPALTIDILYHALPNAFIPLFSRAGHDGGRTRRVAWGILSAMGLVSCGLWLLAAPIASVTNAGFAANLKAETIILVRIIAGSVFLATIEALARSRLLAEKRFVQTGFSSLWYSLAMIVAVTLFPDGGARSLAWGFLAGAACVALWNLIPSTPRGAASTVARTPAQDERTDVFAGRWVTAILLLNSIGIVYSLIDRHLGSFLAEGSIAAMQYANTVASQPIAVCATALGTAILPYLADRINANDRTGVASLVNRTVRWALIGAIPPAVAASLLGNAIITVLFERGEFDAAARTLTGSLLTVYGAWIIPAVLGAVIAKIFYADFRWRPITLAMIAALVVKTGLSFWWVRSFDVVGLVAATAVATALSTVLLFTCLPAWSLRGLWPGWLRLAAVTASAFAIPCFLASLIPHVLPMLSWRSSAVVSVLAGVGGGSALLLVFGPRFGMIEMAQIRTAGGAVLLRRR